jgi:hyaluronan synthase
MILDQKVDRDAGHHTSGAPRVSAFGQCINVLGCGLVIPLYYLTTAHSRFPVTLDIIITIALTELNRYVIEGRRMSLLSQEWRNGKRASEEKDDREDLYLETQPPPSRLECLAAVVGWREDPSLYARALESYKSSGTCAFLIAGIDGDETLDQDMVNIFNKVRGLGGWLGAKWAYQWELLIILPN